MKSHFVGTEKKTETTRGVTGACSRMIIDAEPSRAQSAGATLPLLDAAVRSAVSMRADARTNTVEGPCRLRNKFTDSGHFCSTSDRRSGGQWVMSAR
jgi:hypothetical protein